MKTTVVVYANSDDALLVWSADGLDDNVEGFSVQRKLRRGRAAEKATWIDNYAPPGPNAYQDGRHAPSDQRPFRMFSWTDHSVEPGDRVCYRVVPFLAGTTAPAMPLASAWSRSVTVGSDATAENRAFFNRGFVISQFMSRYLDEHFPNMDRIAALKELKKQLSTKLDDEIRVFLSGEVRTALLDQLERVAGGSDEIYAALFELNDDELIKQLEAIGSRAHLVLANGSIETKKDARTHRAKETSAHARQRDENAAARRRLRKAGADVQTRNRFVSPGALAHNKFVVFTNRHGKPHTLWTGSTNWTTTGLCTQLNNALLTKDADVAAAYLRAIHGPPEHMLTRCSNVGSGLPLNRLVVACVTWS